MDGGLTDHVLEFRCSIGPCGMKFVDHTFYYTCHYSIDPCDKYEVCRSHLLLHMFFLL